MKKFFRSLAIKFARITEQWVLPKAFWSAMDSDRFEDAKALADSAQSKWSEDPHLAYGRSLLHFLDADACNKIWVVWYTNFDGQVEFHSAWSSEELARQAVARFSRADQSSFHVDPYEVDKDGQ